MAQGAGIAGRAALVVAGKIRCCHRPPDIVGNQIPIWIAAVQPSVT